MRQRWRRTAGTTTDRKWTRKLLILQSLLCMYLRRKNEIFSLSSFVSLSCLLETPTGSIQTNCFFPATQQTSTLKDSDPISFSCQSLGSWREIKKGERFFSRSKPVSTLSFLIPVSLDSVEGWKGKWSEGGRSITSPGKQWEDTRESTDAVSASTTT